MISQHDYILTKSAQAFSLWRETPLAKRLDILPSLASLLREHSHTLALQLTKDMGKPLAQALAEVEKSATLCEALAIYSPQWLAPQILPVSGASLHFFPLGPVLGIMPWNFPYWQSLRFALPTLMAGNAVILKPAPATYQSNLLLQTLFDQIPFPKGLVQTHLIEVPEIADWIGHPGLKGVSLTGSTSAGKSVAQLAGKNLKKCVLELGGSDGFLVFPDADLNKAIPLAVQARLQNNGQSCVAAKRFLIHRDIASHFLSLLEQELISKVKIGAAELLDTTLGPMVNISAAEKLREQVLRACENGAKIIYQMSETEKNTLYFPPLILEMNPHNPLLQEEFFGPVFIVEQFSDEAEAISLCNQTDFGLGASVWSQDSDLRARLGQALDVGMVFFNDMIKSHPLLPFGGINESGLGKELGEWGIREFTNAQLQVHPT